MIFGYEAIVPDHAILGCLWNSCVLESVFSANGEFSRDPMSPFFPFSLGFLTYAISLYCYHGLLEALPLFIVIFFVP